MLYAEHMRVKEITGEVLSEELPTGPYLRLFFEGIDRALRSELTVTDYRVLFAVWRRSPIDGWPWDSAPALIGDDLDIAPTVVHKSLRKLTEQGLLLRPIRGKVAFVKSVAWRGPMRSA